MQKQKQRKRFEREQEILDAIDAAKNKVAEYMKEAAGFDHLKAEAALKSAKEEQIEGDAFCAQFWRDQMDEYKKKAEKKHQQANRIRDVRLKELGEKLAQMRTEPMMFLAGDKSVAA